MGQLIYIHITLIIVIIIAPKVFEVFHSPCSSPASLAFDPDQSFNNGSVLGVVRHNLAGDPQWLERIGPAATVMKIISIVINGSLP